MKHCCFCALLCMYSFMSVAQTDSIKYYNKDWILTTKDSAYYYSLMSYSSGLYKTSDYFSKTNKIQMEGAYLDSNKKKSQGLFKWYYENGMMSDSAFYDNGKRLRGWSFYDNGNKRAAFTTVADSLIAQGWDENGIEIPNYIFDKQAEFPGGKNGWRRYLERNLDASVPRKANAPNGVYTVKLTFTVNEKGKISKVFPSSIPQNCAPCVTEAIRVVKNSPDWIPYIKYGKPISSNVNQSVSFQVATN